jgi:hypothetical protein
VVRDKSYETCPKCGEFLPKKNNDKIVLGIFAFLFVMTFLVPSGGEYDGFSAHDQMVRVVRIAFLMVVLYKGWHLRG